jgi:uncharacterized protein YndB with AHSA1/START domain
MTKEKITIETTVNAPVEKVWKTWNTPEDVKGWNAASDDWHTPSGQADLRPGGAFNYRMEAKDGSFGFDFGGVYDEVKPNEKLAYTIGDGRKVEVNFIPQGQATRIVQTFEAEGTNPVDMQRQGWQAIMDNHKKYTEAK